MPSQKNAGNDNQFVLSDDPPLNNQTQNALPDDQIKKFLDEKGKPLFNNNNENRKRQDSIEGDSFQEYSFKGTGDGDYYGFSVASAGDVNADGYDDIIIGAYLFDVDGIGYGKAYIYFGGAVVNTVVDVHLSGSFPSRQFGRFTTSAGDVNRDGYDDVIVGEGNGSRAYIYFGGANMNSVADITLNTGGPVTTISVSTAGDVDGDGYSDVMIGDLNYNSGTGRVYLYLGGTVMDNVADVIFTGESSFNNFGASLSSAGDVNADGYSDIIIGASVYNTYTGRAYIFWGGTNMNNTADVIMSGENVFNGFGYSVSTAGDVNKDGFTDVIVGAYGYDSNRGRAYIYYGGMLMNNVADVTMTGVEGSATFGVSVSSADDINGDGYSDVIVGAYTFNNYQGRVYVYYGGAVMNTVADNIFTGSAAGDNFGYLIANAGDVNHDGYSDIIVGAYLNDEGGTDAGKAYLYTNTHSNASIPMITFTGQAIERFGFSVSDAGDVNGDGYADVINSAPSINKVYIYLGGINMDNVADVILSGISGQNFGYSVSSAGDVNNDGYDDVIIGAPDNDKVYVYFGGQNMNNVADVIMTNPGTQNSFGNSVSSIGDMNGDGFSDVIVGEPIHYPYSAPGKAFIYLGGINMDNNSDGILTDGIKSYYGYALASAGDVNNDGYSDAVVSSDSKSYIYFGSAIINVTPDVTLTGTYYFGYSVSSAGDVNGDGYSDVLVGSPITTHDFDGTAYIFFGGANMNNVADVIMKSNGQDYRLSASLSDAGDLNKDGYSDVIVASTGNKKIYVYFGGISMDNIADKIIQGDINTPVESLGSSVSGAGDVDGDSYPDIIASCFYQINYNGKSNVYIFRYPQRGTDIPDEKVTGATAGDLLGFSVSSAGDVNADGFSDFITGAPGNDASGTDAGRAYIYFGGQPMDYTADVVLTGAAAGDLFGISVSTAGDVNYDGFSDVIVGANLNDAGGVDAGRAYIYFGGGLMNNVADVLLTGEAAGDEFGISVSYGNFNQYEFISNTFSDVIVGAHKNDAAGSNAGRAYIFLGSFTMDNIADLTLSGQTAGDGFGVCVANGGDFNYDAYTDFVIGAPYNDAGGSNAGRAYIYEGGIHLNSNPSVTISGYLANEELGLSVANAGEVNGDYFGDIIVGAPRNTVFGLDAGRAYIYYGAALMNNIPDVILTGLAPQTLFGNSVSSAGDLNQDGFGDVIVGAPFGTLPANANGKAYIFYGSTSVDNNADIILSGENPGDLFGFSVANAGDINGDGQSDVISGAYYNDAGGIDAGRAYLFISSSPLEQCVLTLRVLPQGFYSNATKTLNSSDTVTIKLRSPVFPYNIIDQTKGVVNKNTFTGKFFFRTAPTGNYYLDVRHRNSIETWSASPVGLTRNTNVVYDFTNASLKAYGSNMIQVDNAPLRFGIYSGDENQDGNVDITDVIDIFNDMNALLEGYVKTDITGDYIVDSADLLLAFNNSNNIVAVVTP